MMGAAEPGPSNFQMIGRGPARSIKFPHEGPQPGPAHKIFKTLGPGPTRPTNFSNSRRPSPSMFPILSARPGPAHQIFNFFLPSPARCITFSKFLARPGPHFRPITCPLIKGLSNNNEYGLLQRYITAVDIFSSIFSRLLPLFSF